MRSIFGWVLQFASFASVIAGGMIRAPGESWPAVIRRPRPRPTCVPEKIVQLFFSVNFRIRGFNSWPRARIAAESVAILQAAELICYHVCSVRGCGSNDSESVLLINIISLGISYGNTCIDMYMTFDRWRVLMLALEDGNNGDQDVEEDATEPIGWPSILAFSYVIVTIFPAWIFFMIIGPAAGWNMRSSAFNSAWNVYFIYVSTIGTCLLCILF
jgi:hypothetical protein